MMILEDNERLVAPVDLDHLRLFTDGDKEEEQLLFDLFFQQADISINGLRATLAEGEIHDWKSAAHRLKGAAANLGAVHLSEQCRLAEVGYDSPSAQKQTMLDCIIHELTTVREFLHYDQ